MSRVFSLSLSQNQKPPNRVDSFLLPPPLQRHGILSSLTLIRSAWQGAHSAWNLHVWVPEASARSGGLGLSRAQSSCQTSLRSCRSRRQSAALHWGTIRSSSRWDSSSEGPGTQPKSEAVCNRGGGEHPHRGALEAGWPKRVLTHDSSSRCGHHTGQALAGRLPPECSIWSSPCGRRGPEPGKGLPGFLGGRQARSRACTRGCLVFAEHAGRSGLGEPVRWAPVWTALLRCWGLGGGSETRG